MTGLIEVDVARPNDGQVTVEVAVSIVSPGTERARYLALENARVKFPHRPGYLSAGRVTDDPASELAGRDVAVRYAPHQRLLTVPRADVHEIPEGVALVPAAAWWLGVTALYGLTVVPEARIERLAVVGSGLLGVLARRLATARGATGVVAIAASDAKRWTLEAERDTEFVVATDRHHVDELDVEVVVDATGTAEGLLIATAMAPPGATVVLLGSPRVDLAPLPVGDIRAKGLRVVGAHVETMRQVQDRTGADPERELSREYFEHLRSGALALDDVLAERIPPVEAPLLYRRLVSDRRLVSVAFDWEAPRRAAATAPSAVPLLRAEHPAVRFAMLGCGDIGVQNAAAIAAATGAELTACFDPVDRLADDVSQALGAETAPSTEALLERDDVDVVFVATPHDLHEPLVLDAIAAGKHVVVEKPLAADLPAAARIAAAARGARTSVTVCLPMRDDVRVVAGRQAIAEGLVGVLHGALAVHVADKPPSYYFGGFSSRAPSTWRLSKERSGGGVLIMNLLHHIDMVRYLLDREAIAVRASTMSLGAPDDIEELASVVVEFDGALATFAGGSRAARGPGEALRLWGDVGHLEILPKLVLRSLLPYPLPKVPQTARRDGVAAQRSLARRLVARARRGRRPAAVPPEPDEELDRRVRFVERVASGVAAGERPGPTAEDGLALQAIIAAAYRSAEDGAVVRPAELLAQVNR